MSETVWAKAKAEIQRRGWNQGWFYDRSVSDVGTAPVCVAGAVCAVTTGFPWKDDDWRVERSLIRLTEHLDGPRIADWNDHPDRTVDEVYALLDELDAAERAS